MAKSHYEELREQMLKNRDRLKEQTREWRTHPPKDGVWGYPTGLQNIDLPFGGLAREEITVIAGGAGSGKTAFLTQIMENACREQGNQVHLFVSAEMSQRQLYLRNAARMACLDSQEVKASRLTMQEWARFENALDDLMSLPLLVVDTPGVTSEDVQTMVNLLRDEGMQVGIVGVDYVQLLADEGQNGNMRLTSVMQRMMHLKNDAECSIVLLSQYSRRKEWESRTSRGEAVDRPPQLSDLRDSGSIEQGADQVWMFHDPLDGKVQGVPFDANVKLLYVRKNRNGRTGVPRLWFLPVYTRFTDADDHSFENELRRIQAA